MKLTGNKYKVLDLKINYPQQDKGCLSNLFNVNQQYDVFLKILNMLWYLEWRGWWSCFILQQLRELCSDLGARLVSRNKQTCQLEKDHQGGGIKGAEDISNILFTWALRTTLRPVCRLQGCRDFGQYKENLWKNLSWPRMNQAYLRRFLLRKDFDLTLAFS